MLISSAVISRHNGFTKERAGRITKNQNVDDREVKQKRSMGIQKTRHASPHHPQPVTWINVVPKRKHKYNDSSSLHSKPSPEDLSQRSRSRSRRRGASKTPYRVKERRLMRTLSKMLRRIGSRPSFQRVNIRLPRPRHPPSGRRARGRSRRRRHTSRSQRRRHASRSRRRKLSRRRKWPPSRPPSRPLTPHSHIVVRPRSAPRSGCRHASPRCVRSRSHSCCHAAFPHAPRPPCSFVASKARKARIPRFAKSSLQVKPLSEPAESLGLLCGLRSACPCCRKPVLHEHRLPPFAVRKSRVRKARRRSVSRAGRSLADIQLAAQERERRAYRSRFLLEQSLSPEDSRARACRSRSVACFGG